MTILAEPITRHPRRVFCLRRAAAFPPPTYDQLVREVIRAFPPPPAASIHGARRHRHRAVRAVRALLWDGLAETVPGELIVLTDAGRHALRAAECG